MSVKSRILSVFALMLLAGWKTPLSQAASDADVLAIYFNEGARLVEIDILSKDRREGTNIPLSAGRIDRAVISEGRMMVYAPAKEMAKRKLLSSITTPSPKSSPEFFDKMMRSFYFRIVDGKIRLVRPQDLTTDEKSRLKTAMRELKRASVDDN
jgi:hypothetical protein